MFRHCNIYGSMIEGKTGSDRPALDVYFHGVVTSVPYLPQRFGFEYANEHLGKSHYAFCL